MIVHRVWRAWLALPLLVVAAGAIGLLGTMSACGDDESADVGAAFNDFDVGDVTIVFEDVERGAFFGDFTISDNTSYLIFQGYETISGDLEIRAPDVESINLFRLEQIGGSLRISGNDALTEISIDNLAYIGNDLTITANPLLVTFDALPALTYLRDDLLLAFNDVLTSVIFEQLQQIDGTLAIGIDSEGLDAGPSLTSVTFSALAYVDDAIQVVRNGALTTIDFGSVVEIGELFAENNASLQSLSLPGLTTIFGSLAIAENASISTLGLNALVDLDGEVFRIVNNPNLPSCQVNALLGRVRSGGFGGSETIAGNDDAAACADICSPVGDVDGNGDVCQPDGVYGTACNLNNCLPGGSMCQTDTSSSRFNQCQRADTITSGCAASNEFEDDRDEGGPVIYNLSYAANTDADADCALIDETFTAFEVAFDYFDDDSEEEGMGNAYSTTSDEAVSRFVWARQSTGEEDPVDPVAGDLPLLFGENADQNDGRATMTICAAEAPSQIAVQIRDMDNVRSNIACVSF